MKIGLSFFENYIQLIIIKEKNIFYTVFISTYILTEIRNADRLYTEPLILLQDKIQCLDSGLDELGVFLNLAGHAHVHILVTNTDNHASNKA